MDGAGGDDEARAAPSSRWRGLFKLAKSKDMPALDASEKSHGAEGCAAPPRSRGHGETLNIPLRRRGVVALPRRQVPQHARRQRRNGRAVRVRVRPGRRRMNHPRRRPRRSPRSPHVVGAGEAECARRARGGWWATDVSLINQASPSPSSARTSPRNFTAGGGGRVAAALSFDPKTFEAELKARARLRQVEHA